MPQGQIAENKAKTTIVLEKELKADLESIAKQERRSLNNLMTNILADYVESKKKR